MAITSRTIAYPMCSVAGHARSKDGPRHRSRARSALERLVVLAAGIWVVASPAVAGARYTDLRRIEPIHGDAQAGAQKAAVCLGCHGVDGAMVAPTFPRLAGQRVDYLYHRLLSFKHADPKDPYYSVSPMTAMAAPLSDTDMRDLAAYFAAQTPAAPQPVAPELAAPEPSTATAATATAAATNTAATAAAVTSAPASAPLDGAALFLNGNPARGIPPCQGCHGADANGASSVTGQYAAYPSLRGQYAPYVVARLTHYHAGQPSDTSNTFIMQGVAATLDDDSIQAIATWLNSLPPRKSL